MLSFLVIMVGIVYGFVYIKNKEFLFGQVIINNKIINVELAKTSSQHIQGLSNRSSLDAYSGMLFIFADKQIRSFWMKEMEFPLDIIWILDNKIVGIESNVPIPENINNLPSYLSPESVNYVLEINAGFAEKNNIKIGDMVELP